VVVVTGCSIELFLLLGVGCLPSCAFDMVCLTVRFGTSKSINDGKNGSIVNTVEVAGVTS
jgi:hypothetical protein